MNVPQAIKIGLVHHQAGRLQEAEQIYQQVLKVDSDNPDALHLLGLMAHQVGNSEIAVQMIERAVRIQPSAPEYLNNLGEVYRSLRRLGEATTSYEKALAIKPEYAEALSDRGVALQELKRYEEALASYDRALAIKPEYAEALSNRGLALQGLKRYEEALASYDRALAIKPEYAEALSDRGVVLQQLKRYEEALGSYDRALAIKPEYAEALSNRGAVLRELERYEEALGSYDRALAIKPENAEALNNRGLVLQDLMRYEEAVEDWHRALTIKPDFAEAHISCIHGRQHLCEWSGLGREVEALREWVVRKNSGKITPFSFLALPGTQAGEHLLCARQHAEDRYGRILSRPPLHERTKPQAIRKKLRIGYLSADFREHPVSYLLAEVIELHDRNRFEMFGYSYGPDDASSMRRRLQAGLDTFRDIAPLSDAAASRLIFEDRIDILVDLTGYTGNARTAILALRPAPVQVSWLGYPGTLGHPRLADYLIGDSITTPLEHAQHYSETLALMPNCYQPNDRQRKIGRRPTRSEAGLPSKGFVFCCLNQAYKITPTMFDLWCRLLQLVPGSLLWLLQPNAVAQANLRREAIERGIAADRLVFAPRQPLPDHLARFRLADLALDTYPYTSHTTASDALWAGVPLVTMIGETFASRVAASILQSAGSPELVARDPDSYFELVLELATRPERLREVRKKLSANRNSCPLFDSERFTRNLERLYERVWSDHCEGIKEHFILREQVFE